MHITSEELTNFAKEYGFIYQSSEIYNGLANSWDYGPLGVEIINNIKNLWWKKFINMHHENVGIDSSIFLSNNVWSASGHIGNFNDPLIDCKKCKSRFRADKLISTINNEISIDGLKCDEINEIIYNLQITCPNCSSSNFTEVRDFNLMFKTQMGTVEGQTNTVYLRPETAQGIFINFKNILRTTRKKLPLGIGQIGKAFRNEITPGNMVFRTREFEQMELEFFCKPQDDEKWYKYWIEFCWTFLLDLGINSSNLKLHEHKKEELSHYAKATTDIEYNFSFGYGELWGIANRQDYDLSQHMKYSKKNLQYLDPVTNERYLPFCIEPSVGVGRLFLAILTDAFRSLKENDQDRKVLKLDPKISPYKACIMPLSNKLSNLAKNIYSNLIKEFNVTYDSSGSIGKRYYRQDIIGTNLCITVDFDTQTDGCVTLRDRDTSQQKRVGIKNLSKSIKDILNL